MSIELSSLAPMVSDAALTASKGQLPIAEPVEGFIPDPLGVTELTEELTEWASKVDAIEAPFAPDYDVEEYDGNPALALMGFFELRFMLKQFGVGNAKQANIQERPLDGQRFFVAGTGPGREVVWLSGLGATVTGVDATKEYLYVTRDKVLAAGRDLGRPLPVTLMQRPAETYQYSKNSLDGISSLFGVLNHIEPWQETIGKFATALKPGGKLVLSMYGPNEALVFRSLSEGKLPYKPSILQRRGPGGIFLGDSTNILPASFPSPREIARTIEGAGLKVVDSFGSLRIAALFPQKPTEENLQSYLSVIRTIDSKAAESIERYMTPAEILLAAMLYDRRNQQETNDFAYIAFAAEKRGI